MTTETTHNPSAGISDRSAGIRASRYRVPRSRGAISGFLLLLLGAWAALVPMVGPYFDVAYTPAPDDAWHWTAARGWLEVLPGCVAFLGGLLLLISASRVMGMLGGWLAAAAGAWLVVGPPLADALTLSLGRPDPAAGTNHQAFDAVVMFSGVGAVIVFLAALGLGRLSVITVRDVRAAENRVAAEGAEVSSTTHYPPAPPVRETTDTDAAAHGRHRGDDVSDDQPTTALPPTTTDERQAAPAGQQPYATGQYPAQQPQTGQYPSYAQSAPQPTDRR